MRDSQVKSSAVIIVHAVDINSNINKALNHILEQLFIDELVVVGEDVNLTTPSSVPARAQNEIEIQNFKKK